MKNQITRGTLGSVLSSQMSTRTMQSGILYGTIFEEWEINDSWIVVLIETDERTGVLNIYCIPQEYK